MIVVHSFDTHQPIRRGDILVAPPTREGQSMSLWRAKGRGWSNASEDFMTYPGATADVHRIMGLPGAVFSRAMGVSCDAGDYAEANRATRISRSHFGSSSGVYLLLRVVYRLNRWEAMDVPDDTPKEMLDMLVGNTDDSNGTAELFQHLVMQSTVSAHRSTMYLKAYTAEEQIRLDIQGEP